MINYHGPQVELKGDGGLGGVVILRICMFNDQSLELETQRVPNLITSSDKVN